MRTEPECLPCFHRQVERSLAFANATPEVVERVRVQASKLVNEASYDQPPARISTLLHRIIRRETATDPYRPVKQAYTSLALDRLPLLRRRAALAASPLDGKPDILAGSVLAAIAGNVIDFGIYDEVDLDRAIEETFALPLPAAAYAGFSRAVDRATTILYLCDNAGEIVFDRVLIDTLRARGKDVTAVVKGMPVINDATNDDAAASGLDESACRVITNGNDGIGTLLELCSPEFRNAYQAADLVISKGQANYETLVRMRGKATFFLFMVKCEVVAKCLGRKNGDIVLQEGA